MTRRAYRALSTNVKRELRACSGCGEDLWVPYNRVNAVNYCDRCCAERERDRIEEYNEDRRRLRKEAPERRVGEFLMILDLDGWWGRETRLNEDEILDLARVGSIVEGTVFQKDQEQWIVRGGDFIKV